MLPVYLRHSPSICQLKQFWLAFLHNKLYMYVLSAPTGFSHWIQDQERERSPKKQLECWLPFCLRVLDVVSDYVVFTLCCKCVFLPIGVEETERSMPWRLESGRHLLEIYSLVNLELLAKSSYFLINTVFKQKLNIISVVPILPGHLKVSLSLRIYLFQGLSFQLLDLEWN